MCNFVAVHHNFVMEETDITLHIHEYTNDGVTDATQAMSVKIYSFVINFGQ